MSASADAASQARALWVVAPGRAELRVEPLPVPGEGQALVRATRSGISRGTESLVFRGGVPLELHERMRCPHQAGSLSLPVKYGYCSTGVVERGPEGWPGRRVFCLHPHQDRYVVPISALSPVPDAVPDSRAVLAANMETAINALWDAAPPLGARVAVIGAGAVGLLCASLLSALPGVDLEVVDVDSRKDEVAGRLGLRCVRPEQARGDCDLALHASGSGEGLSLALSLLGFEGRVVELSWYGDRPVRLELGGRFHDQRLSIQSSQVGSVSPAQRSRWSYARRMGLSLRLLADDKYDALLSAPTPFEQLPAVLPGLFSDSSSTVTQLVDYGQ